MILQSDNARLYQNANVPFFINMLIIYFPYNIHTQKGFGKGMIDAYFTTMMKIVRAYIDTGLNSCNTSNMVCILN